MRKSRFGLAMVVGLLPSAWALGQTAKEAVVDQPLAPLVAAGTMKVPDGFRVTLFAGEPDVKQPIAFCFDDRGRLWVAEANCYPDRNVKPTDRILVFADTNGDGQFDTRTVFYDRLNYVTGIEYGFGGVWVMSPPAFYFFPDRDRDDRPDGPPVVLLDGFGAHANAHNLASALAWGPDGWLYGTHGRTNWSTLGKPGTPAKERRRFDGGVYRYHPTRHVWEPFADGMTNPWGLDWNDVGDAFACNCVNPHLFHVIAGAHYEPWRNRESSQYAYQRIETIADHLHFVGKGSVRAGLGSGEEDAAGGGHAHCGSMVYLGDNWPSEYRNQFFTNNIHGHRINNDLLRRKGSGYTASHGKDLLRARDPWFMGVTLRYGPDGGVFVSDWSDTGECHSIVNTRRHTGRIYKITYGNPKQTPVDYHALSLDELVERHLSGNDWHVRTARRILQERAATGVNLTGVGAKLRRLFAEQNDVPRKLRALWTLSAIGQADDAFLLAQLDADNESLRAWGVRLLCDGDPPSETVLQRLERLAANEPAPYVRLSLASGLQRIPPGKRFTIVKYLAAHAEDAGDQNLPWMLWYAAEPIWNADPQAFVSLVGRTRIPLLARFVARRALSASDIATPLADLLQQAKGLSNANLVELLAGINEGLEGRRRVAMPGGWPALFATLAKSPSSSVQESALQLALLFDDPEALRTLMGWARDAGLPPVRRGRAIDALVAKQTPELATLLADLVADPATRRSAIRGLAATTASNVPDLLLTQYANFDGPARQDVVQTLASRAAWADRLLTAIEQGKIARGELSAISARQIVALGNDQLTDRLRKTWGELRTTPAGRAKQIADLKRRLTPEALKQADRSAGRALFVKTCANCHQLFDAGGKIGPNLTGSQRTNLDYLLQTILDPNAAVAKDFQMHVVSLTDGRTITGLLAGESKTALILQTSTERIVVPLAEVESRKISPVSMMPEGMLQNLTASQIRDLVGYLMSPEQAPLPISSQNNR